MGGYAMQKEEFQFLSSLHIEDQQTFYILQSHFGHQAMSYHHKPVHIPDSLFYHSICCLQLLLQMYQTLWSFYFQDGSLIDQFHK